MGLVSVLGLLCSLKDESCEETPLTVVISQAQEELGAPVVDLVAALECMNKAQAAAALMLTNKECEAYSVCSCGNCGDAGEWGDFRNRAPSAHSRKVPLCATRCQQHLHHLHVHMPRLFVVGDLHGHEPHQPHQALHHLRHVDERPPRGRQHLRPPAALCACICAAEHESE